MTTKLLTCVFEREHREPMTVVIGMDGGGHEVTVTGPVHELTRSEFREIVQMFKAAEGMMEDGDR